MSAADRGGTAGTLHSCAVSRVKEPKTATNSHRRDFIRDFLFDLENGTIVHPVWSRYSTGLKRRGLQPRIYVDKCPYLHGLDFSMLPPVSYTHLRAHETRH